MYSERKENLLRIVVAIVSGILLGVWKALIQVLVVFHWFYVLFTGERLKNLAEFCEIWNSQIYKFIKYMAFMTNERPFPFASLGDNTSKFDKKLNN